MRKVAVIFALPIEARPFLKRVDSLRNQGVRSSIFEGHVGGTIVRIGISGIGQDRSQAKTRELLTEHPGPSALVLAGFAGALDRRLASGDLVIPEVVIHDGPPPACYQCDARMLRLVSHADEHADRAAMGRILSVRSVVESAERKTVLSRLHECLAVDTESAAAASVAGSLGVPFVVIRSIVDRAQDDMPVAITRAMRPDGTPRMGRMSAAVAGDPFLILTSARLAAQSRAASRSLAAFLVEYIPRLASTLDLTAI